MPDGAALFGCPIPGFGGVAVDPLHLAVHLGLTAFVSAAGVVFLAWALVAYRRPVGVTPGE